MLGTLDPVALSWQQVATLAGLKARGGHFNGKKSLVDSGLISIAGSLVQIVSPSPTATTEKIDPAALIETWCAALSGAAPKLLRALFDGSNGRSRTDIADILGMQPRGGHWNAGWKELRDNELVVMEGDRARLADLFSGLSMMRCGMGQQIPKARAG